MAHPFGERDLVEQTASKEPMTLDSFGGRIHVRWSPDEAVTPLGQLPFFIELLKQANLFEPYVEDCPLQFSSPNAPEVRDVLGTLMMSIVTGGRRYAHVNALRHDGINPPLLGMSKVCSDDSVRRALKSIDQEKAKVWLKQHLTVPLHPVMQDGGWILDVDSTVKPIYGKQEGAEAGYNPNKRGRPSHCYHSYLIANLRLVLGVDVTPGTESNSPHSYDGKETKLRRFQEFFYGARSWGSKERRVIARIEVGPIGRDTRFIVTSLNGHRSKYLYEKIYCAHGQAENYIKSWKRHLASDRTSCSKANANQMRLMIHHCAYWLMWTLRAACPKRSRWRRAQFDTLRLHLIKIAATVVEKKTRIVMSLPASCPHQSLIRLLFDALAPPHNA